MSNGIAPTPSSSADTIDTSGGRDGRHARRDRNSEAVLDAVIEFLREGESFPTAQQIADRSGVSLRSVFRYYDDMDHLVCTAVAAVLERLQPYVAWTPPAASAPLEERIEYVVQHRTNQFGHVAVEFRAGLARAYRHAGVYTIIEGARGVVRAQLEALFAPELCTLSHGEALALVASAHNLALFESFENLRDRYDLDLVGYAEVLRAGLRRLFADVLAQA